MSAAKMQHRRRLVPERAAHHLRPRARPGRRSLRAVVRAAVALRGAARARRGRPGPDSRRASYAATPGELRIVPGIAIAGFGPVRTVLLVGEVPLAEMTAIALDGASRSSAMLLRLLCQRARPDAALPRGRRTTRCWTPRRGTHRRAGDRRRRASPPPRASRTSSISAPAWRELTGPAVRLRGLGRAAPAPSAPTTSRCCSESLAQGLAARAARSRAPGPRRTAAIPAVYERYLDRQHPLPAGRRGAVRAVARSSTARRAAELLAARRSARGCSRARARIARRRRPAPALAIHRRAARRRRRRRAPVARRRASPVRRARRRWSWAPPPTRAGRRCTPTAWSPTSSTATSTTRTSASPAASSATSTGRPTNKTEGYVLTREELDAEVPGDGRPGRRADPAAGRAEPEAADRLVRGSVPLDEGELPARHPRPVARGDPLHRRDREPVDPRGDRAADRRRPRFDPGRRRRDPRRRDPLRRSRRSSARPTPGWR